MNRQASHTSYGGLAGSGDVLPAGYEFLLDTSTATSTERYERGNEDIKKPFGLEIDPLPPPMPILGLAG